MCGIALIKFTLIEYITTTLSTSKNNESNGEITKVELMEAIPAYSVNVAEPTNGSVVADKTYDTKEGKTVTLTVDADDYYELDGQLTFPDNELEGVKYVTRGLANGTKYGFPVLAHS